MAVDWVIIADDLTGAADCAIAFAKQGCAASVTWDTDRSDVHETAVLSFNADTRGLAAPIAAARHRDVLDRLLPRNAKLFKKIDSTLRGQPAAEIAATIDVLRATSSSVFGIFAPAFPATGRTVEGGCIRAEGKPLEHSEVWRRDHTYPSADLIDVLATAGVRGERISLETIRAGSDALRRALDAVEFQGDTVAVCDAVNQNDLDCIATAALSRSSAALFIGSAGLAHAIAAAMPLRAAEQIRVSASAKGALFVVGSLAAASRASAEDLAGSSSVRYLPVHPELLLDDGATARRAMLGNTVIDALGNGNDVLVEISADEVPDHSIGAALAGSLARTLKPAARHMSALAVTGGETAAALLNSFGVSGIRLVDEIEPGICLGLTLGDLSIPLVTKSGAFGDRGSLIRIAERLHHIRRVGILE